MPSSSLPFTSPIECLSHANALAVVLHLSLTLSDKDLRLDNSQPPLQPSAVSLIPKAVGVISQRREKFDESFSGAALLPLKVRKGKPSASPLRRVVRSPLPLLIVPTEPTTHDTVLPRKSPTRARRHSHMPYFQRFLSMDFASALYKPPLPILDRQRKTVANNIPLLPAFIASRSSLHYPGHNDERSRRYAATVRF